MRLIYVFATALLAYVVSLVAFYPGYISWPVPYNPDMYWSVWAVAKGLNPFDLLLWPRPLYFETAFWAGHLGLTGALCAFGAVLLFDLSLAVMLLERYLLRRAIPWPVVFATFLLAMSGPGFYKQPGNDINFHLALLCALLGVWVWEAQSQRKTIGALCGMAAFFALSVLSNESLVPGIVVYCAVCAYRRRKVPGLAAALAALPLLPIAVSLVDSRLTHSPFVKIASTGALYPYRIDTSPGSMLFWFAQYAGPLVNAGFVVLAAAIAYGLWLRKRLIAGALLVLTALLFYAPYTVLPNHFDTTYRWVAMPLLMLLFPLAWVGVASAASRIALALALMFALVFQRTQAVEDKHWNAVTLAQNRVVLSALHAHQAAISAAHSVLVSGLTFGRWPFQQSAAYLSSELKFAGKWTVTTEPGFAPIDVQPEAAPIAYDRIRWGDYDLILMFDREGLLAGAFTRAQFSAQLAARGLSTLPYREIADRLQFHYPPGIKPPASWAAGAREGLYLEEDPHQCCFLNGRPTLLLDKPANAKSVVFTFEVPQTAPFAREPERVETYVNGERAGPAIAMPPGVHQVNVGIPARLTSSPLTVTLHMSIAYVPEALGMNLDKRQLSIKLLRVEYK